MEMTWEETRARVISRDRGCCARFLGGACSDRLDVHHILPRAEGGTDDLSNLMALCSYHHPKIEALRRALLRRPAWKRCTHAHPYPQGREECERRMNTVAA